MCLIFFGLSTPAIAFFAISMIVMMISLIFSLVEIQISVKALDLHLYDLEHSEPAKN
jgi:hypothetical protein